MLRRTALAVAATAVAVPLTGCGSPARSLVPASGTTPSAAASPSLPTPVPTTPRSRAPATSSPAATPARSGPAALPGVDVLNTTYRTACFSNDGHVRPVRVRHGRATDRIGDVFTVTSPVYGDLTGDRVPDAAVVVSCTRATAGPDNVDVFTSSAAGARLIGTPLDDRADQFVRSLRIAGGTLVIVATGYTKTAPQCCPDLTIRSSYRWDGHRLVRSGSSVTSLPGG